MRQFFFLMSHIQLDWSSSFLHLDLCSNSTSFHLFTPPKKRACAVAAGRAGLAQGSDAAVVWATGSKGCCCSPLHGEEGDCPKEAHEHHDQQLPLQQEVVAVEVGNCSTDGLAGKTKWKDYQWRFPGWCCYRRIIRLTQTQFNRKLSECFCSRQRILRLHYTQHMSRRVPQQISFLLVI